MMKLTVRMEKYPRYRTGTLSNAWELPAAITQGKTEEEAMKNIKDAIYWYLKKTASTRRRWAEG